MTCTKQEICIHEEYCQRHIGQNFDGCILFSRHLFSRNGKPMTNEEWLHTLNTEQLAEWLTFKRKLIRIPETNYEAWLRWLKEKHHE